MNFTLSIDRIEYVLPSTKQTVEDVSILTGITVTELDEHLGFSEKYVTTNEETSLDLAEQAVQKLMRNCTTSPNTIDYIIYAYSGIYEDRFVRSPSAKIQALIGADKAFCFEITNGCNSLNAALHVANSLLSNSDCEKNILIVISDTLSKYIDFTKKNVMHFYMYSDGAAAILVNNYGKSKKLISSALYTDGKYAELSKIRYAIKQKTITPTMETNIAEEFKPDLYNTLISNYIKVITDCMSKRGLNITDIKFLFLSQNSKRVLSDVLNSFSINSEKTRCTGKHLGHVGSIDSVIAFHNSMITGEINNDEYIILAGTGAGFHWGAHLIQM